MSRRKGRHPAPPPLEVDAADLPLPNALPRPPVDRLTIAEVVIRNMIGAVGVLFLGWSAQALIVLYFFDTLGALLSIFAALMASSFTKAGAKPFDRLYNLATALALSGLLVAFIAIPIGMPVFILMEVTSWSFGDALAQPAFAWGVAGILAMALLNTIAWWTRVDAEGQRGERALKREFTLVFGRWFLVILAIFTPLALLVAAAPVILVIVYAVVTTYTELYPERFERLFDRAGKK